MQGINLPEVPKKKSILNLKRDCAHHYEFIWSIIGWLTGSNPRPLCHTDGTVGGVVFTFVVTINKIIIIDKIIIIIITVIPSSIDLGGQMFNRVVWIIDTDRTRNHFCAGVIITKMVVFIFLIDYHILGSLPQNLKPPSQTHTHCSQWELCLIVAIFSILVVGETNIIYIFKIIFIAATSPVWSVWPLLFWTTWLQPQPLPTHPLV